MLLTGATGFVGRQIHRALADAGYGVRVVIRTGTAARLAVAGADICQTEDLFAQDAAWWAQICAGQSAIIHAAWFVDPARYLSAPENLDCVRGSLALARGAAAAGVGHVIGVGTCFEYALPSQHLTWDAPLGPQSLYARCKLDLFHTLSAFFAGTDTRFSWARLFYLHGAGEHPARLVPYLRRCLAAGEPARLSAGTQIRDFMDVADAGAMIARLVATAQPGAINICSGQAVTVRQLAERIADEYGRRDLLEFGIAPLRATDPPAVVGVCNLMPLPFVGKVVRQ